MILHVVCLLVHSEQGPRGRLVHGMSSGVLGRKTTSIKHTLLFLTMLTLPENLASNLNYYTQLTLCPFYMYKLGILIVFDKYMITEVWYDSWR